VTRQEQLDCIADQLEHWLGWNLSRFPMQAEVSDDVRVRPPELPTRGVLKEWIGALRNNK
jgi:hypothetical protein